ncbi:selenocysteine-specific translation elongation factor [Desulfatirhabdium butyrativorans]|uniref:selenocysteine-specific translation elongation factor n=1 Tax=Desulfatirhabdium butyrativorans TaxID=340467 RepID=UPI00042200FF|nr:selenocysteine-specific translation elongation factor [Desulfatirhabdium butyrativorans]
MKQLVLGTAGHIDHGKTSLIRALTGINTDRLKEEQVRGITIELGFASLVLPGGELVGIVDVPGHEKFVKTMVAGATGIDLVAMIIAADEGVMPQTREHLEICSLLGIRHGIIVLTKIDMVDAEWKELVQEDIRNFVKGTFLESAPMIPVSSVTGEGIAEVITVLDKVCASIEEKPPSSIFRLPVDRVFTMKGFGTVITGTLISGQVRVGELVMLYPSLISSRVRGLQVHNKGVDVAHSGMRTAVNFQGLEKTAVNRGDVLSNPDALFPSYMLDVSFHLLPGIKKPVKNRTRIRFHTGTSEILGNLILLDREEIQPGETVYAQLRLDAPVVTVKDDRYVIRSYSPVRTIGGGAILNPIARKHKRFREEILQHLAGTAGGSPEELIALQIQDGGYDGLSFSALRVVTNIADKLLENGLQQLLNRKTIVLAERDKRIYVHADHVDGLRKRLLESLDAFHRQYPLKPGMSKEELKSKLPADIGQRLYHVLLAEMVKHKEITEESNLVRKADHAVSLAADQTEVRNRIEQTYRTAGLTPPYFKEFCKSENLDPPKARDVLQLLIDEGRIVKVKEDLFFHGDALMVLRQKLVAFLTAHGEIAAPQFKDLTGGASRKYLIPLLEYFDSKNVTIRVGDTRKLRNG